MHVAIIGGASTIGSTVAYALTTYRQDIDVTLIDINEDAAMGHATDLTHGGYHLAHAPRQQSGGRIRGLHPTEIDTIDADIAIVTASSGPPPEGELDRDFRDTRIDPIKDLLDNIANQLDQIGPLPVINVTNPLDRVTYYFWQCLGWDRRHFIGYALSESARVADAIAKLEGVHPHQVWCPTLGEHGEHMVLAFSKATIQGSSFTPSSDERSTIRDYVQDIPITIANQRGLSESSRWVTASGIVRVIQHMDSNTESRPLCLSTPLQGEYGFDSGCLSVPVRLDRDGITEIIEWSLPEEERDALSNAHRQIVSTLPDMET